MTTQRGDGIREFIITGSTIEGDCTVMIENGLTPRDADWFLFDNASDGSAICSEVTPLIQGCKIIDDEPQSDAGIYLAIGMTDRVWDLRVSD